MFAFASDAALAQGPILTQFGGETGSDRLDSLRAVAIDPSGRFAALAGEPETPGDDFAVQIRNAGTGNLLRTLRGHEGSVRSLAFSPRGDRLATLTADADGVGVLRIFDIKSGQRLLAVEASGRIVRFLPNGEVAVAGFGRVLRFDPESGRETARFPTMPIVKDVSTDGRLAIGVSHYGQNVLEVRDVAAQRTLVRLTESVGEPLTAAFSPDGRTVAVSDPRTRTVIVWEVLTGRPVHRFDPGTTVAALAFTSDGRYLLAGGFNMSIQVWEIATGSSSGRLAGHDGPVMALATGPRQTLLSGSSDRSGLLWSLDSVRTSTLPEGPFTESEVDDLWRSLGEPDASEAYRSLGTIGSHSDELLPEVVRRVERQLVPVPDADLAQLLAELDDPDYRVRERATTELARAGDSHRSQLEHAFANSPSLEVKARLRLLLRRSGPRPRFTPGDVLRLQRLIAAAESLTGDDAQRLLRLIAEEFPEPDVANEARAALRRRE